MLMSLIIFNPYILRFFFAVPTILLDLFFLISIEILILGFLLNRKIYIFFGLALSVICRQNGLFVLLCLLSL